MINNMHPELPTWNEMNTPGPGAEIGQGPNGNPWGEEPGFRPGDAGDNGCVQ